jgi:hypothetical protein
MPLISSVVKKIATSKNFQQNFQPSTSNSGRRFATECMEAFHRGAGDHKQSSLSSVNTSYILRGKKIATSKNIQQNFQPSTSNNGRRFTTECTEAFHRGAGDHKQGSLSSVNTSYILRGKKITPITKKYSTNNSQCPLTCIGIAGFIENSV